MRAFQQYWTFSAIRGAMTVIASIFIIAVPLAASSMLSLPVLLGLAIDCLATYTIFDGAVMILLAKLMPARAVHRRFLYLQATLAVALGAMFYLVVYGAIGISWLLWIAAGQAAIASLVEFAIARNTHRQYGWLSCYSTSIVLGLCAIMLPLAKGLNATNTSLVLAGYVCLYGASELILGCRMLFLEYRVEHPAAVPSEAWKTSILEQETAPLHSLAVRNSRIGCAGCPADLLCHDDSLSGQVGKILLERSPAIVVSTKVASLLNHQVHPAAA